MYKNRYFRVRENTKHIGYVFSRVREYIILQDIVFVLQSNSRSFIFYIPFLFFLLDFCHKILVGDGDLRMVLCHSMNAGSVVMIPLGGGDI